MTEATPPPEVYARIDGLLRRAPPPSPCIVVDTRIVRERYRALRAALPQARILYAVKANPAPDVIRALAKEGAGFDLASDGEVGRCLDLGIVPARLSFGNTIKRGQDIARARAEGLDLFAFDSAGEVDKLARFAPGARVFCRIMVSGKGAQWPLTRKFGCAPAMATELLLHAKTPGLRPVGVSFHVGSQQTDPGEWRPAVSLAAGVFRACARRGLGLELLNLGGGLPATYRDPVPPLSAYAAVIEAELRAAFGQAPPQVIIEPGRYLVGDAGILRATVLLVARKSRRAVRRWVFLDAGRYNGLPETQGERIRYRIRVKPRPPGAQGAADGPVVLAGPTCDSSDILFEHSGYRLPLDLEAGEPLDFLSAGAYTASYASVEFNGFAPIRTHCI